MPRILSQNAGIGIARMSPKRKAALTRLKHFLRGFGYDIVTFTPTAHPLARRAKLLESYGISVVLDVGASRGHFGKTLREVGYEGRLVSFEPLHDPYTKLAKRAKTDELWEVHNVALGDRAGKALINVAGNSQSSSLLDMLPAHLKAAPKSRYIGQEEVTMATIDSMFALLCTREDSVYLKIDTQGFESKVLMGAEKSARFIDTIQLEMSLVPLYRDELLFETMHARLREMGYGLVSIEPGFTDKSTGELLQVDGIFHRTQPVPVGRVPRDVAVTDQRLSS